MTSADTILNSPIPRVKIGFQTIAGEDAPLSALALHQIASANVKPGSVLAVSTNENNHAAFAIAVPHDLLHVIEATELAGIIKPILGGRFHVGNNPRIATTDGPFVARIEEALEAIWERIQELSA